MSSLDFEDGLAELWGDTALNLLRTSVKKGDINVHHVRMMAARMDVRNVFERENNRSADITDILESMLEAWYNKELYGLKSERLKAQKILIDILKKSNCSNKTVSTIENALWSHGR